MNQPTDDDRLFAAMANMVGPENLLFASDLPHGVSDLPETVVDRLSDSVTADELADILANNTERVYGL
jgi:predicted TIM-barrel fold metal-dependent hydrolase